MCRGVPWCPLVALGAAAISLFTSAAAVAQVAAEARGGPQLGAIGHGLPAENDFTAESLRRVQRELTAAHGGDFRNIPLDVKAEHLEWVLVRYLMAPTGLVHRVHLPSDVGEPPQYAVGEDDVTWNGALLAALSFKYAVTRDAETRVLIGRVLDGLHLAQQATGQKGLIARCVMRSDVPVGKATRRYTAPDGTVSHVVSDAAKGTINQVVAGYAAMMMFVYDDLPAETQERAREDLAALVGHLVDHKYQLTEADGKHTEFGDLRPLIGTVSVPFNAQVAYTIIAAGHHFPGRDLIRVKMIRREYERLREKHHVYYESPLRNLAPPQVVSSMAFIKGMNDRNHVHNAAFIGLLLECHACRKAGTKPDPRFVYELGQTLFWTMEAIQHERNALCNFMWAGLLTHPDLFPHLVPGREGRARQQFPYVIATGLEQLRRCPVDRFFYPGNDVETREPQWVDAQKPHQSYHWKAGGYSKYVVTGPPQNSLSISVDYLYAYWLMRYFRLDEALEHVRRALEVRP